MAKITYILRKGQPLTEEQLKQFKHVNPRRKDKAVG